MACALRAPVERLSDLKAPFDDCPLLDERHPILDPDYHDFRARGNGCHPEREGQCKLTSAEMFVRDVPFTSRRDLCGDDCQSALNLLIFGRKRGSETA